MSKIKTITLTTWERLHPTEGRSMQRVWKVTKVTDSIEYHPGHEFTSKDEVEGLARSKDWKVIVTAL